jgi:hypothetical protein
MSDNGHAPTLRDAVADAVGGELRSGSRRAAEGPHPQEFDTNGFPVPQPSTSFVQRVARLLDSGPEGQAEKN